jgi:DNA repair protein RecN (Recombination protein N)
MLSDLRVRQLGVIDDLTVRLAPGMTALTGETGAGKTLLVEALQLVLGQRADPGLVRAGAAEAVVEARFVDDDGAELIVSRSVPVQGRSRCLIDGDMAPVSRLVELAPGLVDIHGQHDQQSLLSAAAQRAALDTFGGLDAGPVEAGRRHLHELERRIAALGGDPHQRAREADILRHQINEIDRAALDDPDEMTALLSDEERLGDLSAHRAAAAAALAVLDSEEGSDDSALDVLGRAASALGSRPAFAQWFERLKAISAEAADVASDLRGVVETWEDDPARLAAVQERRRLLADLNHKYGGSHAAVLEFADDARVRLADLESADDLADTLQREHVAVAVALRAAEAVLGSARREVAPRLALAVTARLQDLAMQGARVEVAVGEGAGDDVQFLLSANAGEPVRPLAKVASGGELARTMLALRLVAVGGPATMVFDEVDAGVGGEAALALARALTEVANGSQVLVVTHLAQVAAFADQQIAVKKRERQGRTFTEAVALSDEARVVEISRMLSGHPNSARARAHAEELLAARHGSTEPTPAEQSA